MEGILIQGKDEAFVVTGTLPKSMRLATLSAQEEETYSRRRPPIGVGVPAVPSMGEFVAESQGWTAGYNNITNKIRYWILDELLPEKASLIATPRLLFPRSEQDL